MVGSGYIKGFFNVVDPDPHGLQKAKKCFEVFDVLFGGL